MESFNNSVKTGYKFTLERTKDGKLTYMLTADNIVWDSIKQLWQANNYYERFVPETKLASIKSRTVGEKGDYKEVLKFGVRKELVIDFHPKDIIPKCKYG